MKKITLKKLVLGLGITLLGGFANAQGLEGIIVEQYYISDANDAANSVGTLPVGSVTWRIFVDMLPGYKFQAIYGVPGHTLSFNTTTTFFNNEDRGATTPAYTKNQAAGNSIMLDSWFSVGGAASNSMGVPKADDNGVANVVNSNGMLQNAAVAISLTTQDGFITGAPQSVTFVGINAGGPPGGLDFINDVSQVGGSFSTTNGSVASLNGSVGPDTLTNKVLIGQFTTDGVFCFELNIQIGTPTFTSENYVAQNPTGSEIQRGDLIWCSNTVSVNNPATPASSASFNIYPNPATDMLTIDITSSDKSNANSYRIMDVIGNTIADKNIGMVSGKHFEKVDISSFAKGIYFVEVTMDGVKSTKKIIKY